MELIITDRNPLLDFGNRRQAQDLPVRGVAHQKSGKVVHVHTLRDHDNRARISCLCLVKPDQATEQMRMTEPTVHSAGCVMGPWVK